MPTIIIEVQNTRDLKRFIRFPNQLFRQSPYWVPNLFFDELNTLHWDKNPAFEHCEVRYWMAMQNNKIVGRVAAILNNKHLEKWGQQYLRFGWLDFIDDPEVSEALLKKVENWAIEKGMLAIHGPLGFTDLDREGMLVEGFDELGTMATFYNYAYYPKHMQRLGYLKDTDWVEYEITVPLEPDEKIARAADIALKRNNLKLLKVKTKNQLRPYAMDLFRLLDTEYAKLYGTVPLTDKQMQAYIKTYLGFINPEFVPIVLDENDQMVAFGITMPSLSKALQASGGNLFPFGFIHLLRALKQNDRGDLYLVAVKSDYQGKGINAVLMDQIIRVFNKLGITKVESNPELETNLEVQAQWKLFKKRQHKRRRCWIKRLPA
jgi:GNAT superfamily N-acetyltransferase